jgi:hypothetical protein
MGPHDCTIYNKTIDPITKSPKYTRNPVKGVLFELLEGININKYGAGNSNSARIFIYDISVQVKKEDYIVKGIVDYEFTTLADLKSKCEVYIVTSSDKLDFGGLPHIEVGAK